PSPAMPAGLKLPRGKSCLMMHRQHEKGTTLEPSCPFSFVGRGRCLGVLPMGNRDGVLGSEGSWQEDDARDADQHVDDGREGVLLSEAVARDSGDEVEAEEPYEQP